MTWSLFSALWALSIVATIFPVGQLQHLNCREDNGESSQGDQTLPPAFPSLLSFMLLALLQLSHSPPTLCCCNCRQQQVTPNRCRLSSALVTFMHMRLGVLDAVQLLRINFLVLITPWSTSHFCYCCCCCHYLIILGSCTITQFLQPHAPGCSSQGAYCAIQNNSACSTWVQLVPRQHFKEYPSAFQCEELLSTCSHSNKKCEDRGQENSGDETSRTRFTLIQHAWGRVQYVGHGLQFLELVRMSYRKSPKI